MGNKIRVAIVGYGNIGKQVLETVLCTPDFELAGLVRRSIANLPPELQAVKVVTDIKELEKVDVAILCLPTRMVSISAKAILALGINTIDSFDIHTKIWDLRQELDVEAKKHQAVAIVSAGWGPGSDSVIRTLMQAMAPKALLTPFLVRYEHGAYGSRKNH